MNGTIKITIAEPSVILRSGILSVLKRLNAFKIEIYEVGEVEQLKSSLAWQNPDILMINPALPGAFSLQQLKRDAGNPDLKLIALQVSFADSMLLKNYDEVISLYDSADIIKEKLNKLINEPERDKRHESLSGREKEVLVCVIQGMPNKQIADKLCISTHTVITHRRNITAKLGIHSSAGLAIYAIVNNLVRLDDVKDVVAEQ